MKKYSRSFWTSNLDIIIFDDGIIREDKVEESIEILEKAFSNFPLKDGSKSDIKNGILKRSLLTRYMHEVDAKRICKLAKYQSFKPIDMTGCLKGLAMIYFVYNAIESQSYLINFGGDIYGYETPLQKFKIEDYKFDLEISGTYAIFNSGNTSKRGNHIKCKFRNKHKEGLLTNVIHRPELSRLALYDIFTTHMFSVGKDKVVEDDYETILYLHNSYWFDKNGKFLSSTYIASPFFNSYEKDVRDLMIENFSNYYRPDETETSDLFDTEFGHTEEVARELVKDNELWIKIEDNLVFPEYTTDLGTLMELGKAIGHGKGIIRFNYLTRRYTILGNNVDLYTKFYEFVRFRRAFLFTKHNSKNLGILLGFSRAIFKPNQYSVYYNIGPQRDNIMLSIPFTKIKRFDMNNYHYLIDTSKVDYSKEVMS